MPPRLVDLYKPGDRVEILLSRQGAEFWEVGRVVAHQPPAVWVQTEDGALWFVTNGRRIRAGEDKASAPGDDHELPSSG